MNDAHAMLRKGHVPGRGLDLVDDCAGLVLWVTRNSETWMRTSKAGTVRIGDAKVITLVQARDQAERIRIAVAERHSFLGQTEHATGAGLLGALWAVVLTGQRTGPLVTSEVAACVTQFSNSLSGWPVIGWPGPVMKFHMPHGLPVPPEVWAVIERYRQDDAWGRWWTRP